MMDFIDTSLRRPVTVIITTLAIIFFGVYVYDQMPMQKRPDTDFPMVTVVTTMAGANATIMDNDVADVLEDKINGISGVSEILSSSYQGRSVTRVEFNMDKNVNDAASDVRDKVAAAAGDLPDEADSPIVQKLDVTTAAIIQLAITGDASEKDKTFYVDKILKPRLQSVNNVGSVETAGLRKREIRIWVNPATLHARGLVMSDIAAALQAKHVELPAGSILENRHDVDLRVNAEYATVDELKNLPVTTTASGSVIRLGEIARVEDGFAEEANTASYNNDKTIVVSVRKQSGANEVKLSEDILKAVGEVQKSLPSGIKITKIYDQADFIKSSISGAQTDIMSAILLCSILMFIFLQTFRATFVTIITIPVCILGSCIIMQKMNITLNSVSMMGIALSVGMVVDATTVVLENVDRYLHAGLPPMEAVSKGAHEVAFSVIGGVLTTVAVFSPIAFMSGIVGRFFRAFGLTVILTISLSLVLSMTLTPFLCSRLLKVTKLSKIGAYFNSKFNSLEKYYRQTLTAAVHHRRTTMLVAAALFASGIFLASIIGTSFIPNQDEGTFQINCELPSGSSLDESSRVLNDMGKVVRQNPYVKYTYTEIGNNNGYEKNYGTIYVQLIPRNDRPTYTVIREQIRSQTNQFRDVIINFQVSVGKDVKMTLVGASTEELLGVANKIMAEAKTSGHLRDIESDVRMDKPEFDVKLNRGLTDLMNVNIRSLSTELGAIFGGQKVGIFKDAGYRYDIRMMADKDQRGSLSSLSDVYTKNGTGAIIQANNLFTVERTKGPNVIKRYNRQRSVTVTANVTQDYSSGQAMTYLRSLHHKYTPPGSGIKITPTGLSKYMRDDFRSLGISIIVAICLVYVVMAIQFESFVHPFVVMFSLPLLTPGAFGLLFLANCKLDMMSYMGLILLVGIVVNNGIILVDFINQERSKGMDKIQAVITSGPRRLRAILITSTSTMIGAVPAALQLTEGSEMRQGMSIAIFGGLFTSTMLTLLVIPVVYLILDDFKDSYSAKILQWWQRLTARFTNLAEEGPHHD